MLINRHRSKRLSRRNLASRQLDYASLEPRQLLAVTTNFDPARGAFDISMDAAGDSVVVDVDALGRVLVNLSPVAYGGGDLMLGDVRALAVHGQRGLANQSVRLSGDWLHASGGRLDTLEVIGVANGILDGRYEMFDGLALDMSGPSGSGFVDAPGSQLIAHGDSKLVIDQGRIELKNGDHDFGGIIQVDASGRSSTVEVSDANDLVLADVNANGPVSLTAAGNITNTSNVSIAVGGRLSLNAGAGVSLGEMPGDRLKASEFEFQSPGHVSLESNGDVILAGTVRAASVTLVASGNIRDRWNADTVIDGQADLQAMHIWLGDRAMDRFQTGSVRFSAVYYARLNADGDLMIVGKNSAHVARLSATGLIGDAPTASIDVTRLVDLSAEDIRLGETATDEFRAGQLRFQGSQNVVIVADSEILLRDDSTAHALRLEAAGDITQRRDASLTVATLAQFSGDNIQLGLLPGQHARFGSISFQATGSMFVTEDNGTIITGVNRADLLRLYSGGAIQDTLTSDTQVTRVANLAGTSIAIGDSPQDAFSSSALTVNSVGDVVVRSESGVILTQANTARNLTIATPGDIRKFSTADIVIQTRLDVQGQVIDLDVDAPSQFLSLNELTFVAVEQASIRVAGSIRLVGDNQAGSLTLISETGDISDDDLASLLVETTAHFEASGMVVLGDTDFDCVDLLGSYDVLAASHAILLGC